MKFLIANWYWFALGIIAIATIFVPLVREVVFAMFIQAFAYITTKKFLYWFFEQIARAIVKNTKTTQDDIWLEQLLESIHGKKPKQTNGLTPKQPKMTVISSRKATPEEIKHFEETGKLDNRKNIKTNPGKKRGSVKQKYSRPKK